MINRLTQFKTLATLTILLATTSVASAQFSFTMPSFGSASSGNGYGNGWISGPQPQMGAFAPRPMNHRPTTPGRNRPTYSSTPGGVHRFSGTTQNGGQWSGQGQIHSANRFGVVGQYSNGQTKYGAGISRNGGTTNVIGTYSRPGTIPGTVEDYYGGATFRGGQSNFASGGTIRRKNGQPLATAHQNFNGRGYYRQDQGRIGGMTANRNANIGFRGINSSVRGGQSVNAGGVLRTNVGGHASRHGVGGNASMNVGRNRIGIGGNISTKGSSLRVGGMKIGF